MAAAPSNKTLVNTLDDSPGLLVKSTRGLLTGWALLNGAAAVTWVQFFDAAALADVTLGTTTPIMAIPMVASGETHAVGAEIAFTTGIVVFSTTTLTGNTGATVNGTIFWI